MAQGPEMKEVGQPERLTQGSIIFLLVLEKPTKLFDLFKGSYLKLPLKHLVKSI